MTTFRHKEMIKHVKNKRKTNMKLNRFYKGLLLPTSCLLILAILLPCNFVVCGTNTRKTSVEIWRILINLIDMWWISNFRMEWLKFRMMRSGWVVASLRKRHNWHNVSAMCRKMRGSRLIVIMSFSPRIFHSCHSVNPLRTFLRDLSITRHYRHRWVLIGHVNILSGWNNWSVEL